MHAFLDSPRLRQIVLGLIVLAALAAPHVIYPIFLMKVLCFALFACAFNLLLGFGGLLSFGHAAFFGFAGYVAAHTIKVWAWPTELGVLAAALVAAAMGLVFGLLAIRRQGIYFAMVTLALSQMVYFFCVQAPFTGGEDGIQAVPRRPVFGFIDITSDLTLYYVVLAVFALGFLVIWRAVHSPFGQVLTAIRENEARAISLGYQVERYKLLAFVLSAGLSGLAGGMKAVVFQLATLSDVQWQASGEIVLMTIAGGIGTLTGPVVGALLIVGMQNYMASLDEWVLIAQGIVLVLVVLLFQKGVVGTLAAWLGRGR